MPSIVRLQIVSNATCQAHTRTARDSTIGLAETQCAALIRCPSGVHQAHFFPRVPGRWCELGYIPADGAIDNRLVCNDAQKA